MNDNLTDQQQAEIVKKWLKDNGLFIIASFDWERTAQYVHSSVVRLGATAKITP